jgi:hypothetical protein
VCLTSAIARRAGHNPLICRHFLACYGPIRGRPGGRGGDSGAKAVYQYEGAGGLPREVPLAGERREEIVRIDGQIYQPNIGAEALLGLLL